MRIYKMSSKNKKFYIEFFQLYQSYPCLWKVKSEEYMDRNLKSKAYEAMVEKLKEVEPKANREMVVKKINTFRTNYKRVLNKIKKNKMGYENEETTLWYFEHLKFLEEEDAVNGKNTEDVSIFF